MAYLPPGGGRMNVTIGSNTAGVGALISTGTMALAGGSNITLSQNGANGITIHGAAGGGGGGVAFANSQTTYSSGTVNLVGDGQVSVYSAANQSYRISIPGTSSLSATGALSFASNGATISMGVPAFSAGMSSSTYGGSTGGTSGTASNQLIVAAGNNVTLSQSTGAGGNTLAVHAGGGAGLSAGTQSVNSGTVNFANSNGISFGMSGSNQITASHNGLTSQSNQAVSGSNGSVTFQTLSFTNANGISFGTSNNSAVMASYTVPTQSAQTMGLYATGANTTGQSSSNTIDARSFSISAQGGLYAGLSGNTLQLSAATTYAASNHSHGNPTLALTNLSGTTASASNGLTLSLSAAAPSAGGAVISNSQTGYSTGTINLVEGSGAITINSTTGQQFKFNVPGTSSLVGTNGISISTAGNVISIDGDGLSTLGGGATYSYYNPQDAYLQVAGAQGQGTLHIQPTPSPNVSFDRFVFPVSFSGVTSQTASITLSMWAGIYTRNVSTLSLSTSFSTSQAITHSGTANSSVNSGLKLFTMGATGSISEGQYYVGILSRSTTAGNNVTLSQMLASQLNTTFNGLFGVAPVASNQYTRGLGVYSASTSAIPASVAFSQLNGTASIVLRQPLFYIVNGTV